MTGGANRSVKNWRAIAPSGIVAIIMLAVGFVAADAAGLVGRHVPIAYLETYAAITIICLLAWVFGLTVLLARARAPRPLEEVWNRLRPRLPLLVLPGLVAPLFLAGYTIAKAAEARLVRYRWDKLYADLDSWLFGVDPWRLSHAVLGHQLTSALEFFYTIVWGGTFVVSAAIVALVAKPRLVGQLFLSMTLAWLIGGIFLAAGTWAAGPIFAGYFDASLAARFEPLQRSLATLLPPDSSVLRTQRYLLRELELTTIFKGGGISAMPSMHIATAVVYLLAARRSPWFVPALVFALLTLLGSVHFGYHYVVDAPIAALVAVGCWQLADAWFCSRWPTSMAATTSPMVRSPVRAQRRAVRRLCLNWKSEPPNSGAK